VETGCEGESFERSGENKLGGKVKKKEGNGRKEKNDSIEEIIRELCSWDENDRIIENHWDILQLYKNEQVTMVECELGFHIFKGEVNIIFGGSPCQSFSSAGNRTGFDGKSGLFWEYVRILNEVKPKYFLLENVKMKKEWEDIITKEMGVEPISINSNLVSAQNRERLYWTNIPNVTQPENRNIKLNDVLGDSKFREIPKCFYNKWGNKPRIDKGVNWVCNDKSNCLTTKNCHTNQYLFNEDKSLCRLLTADEFERLQTIPEGYTSVVNNTERYKMIGNGWTVDVISHIFSSLK